VQPCTASVVACLTKPSHGVRLAAVGCLYQFAVLQAGLAVSLLPSLCSALEAAHRHITSAAAVAATAAATAAGLTSGAAGKKDKQMPKFAISRSKSGGGWAVLVTRAHAICGEPKRGCDCQYMASAPALTCACGAFCHLVFQWLACTPGCYLHAPRDVVCSLQISL
jgi:hypothetical protein